MTKLEFNLEPVRKKPSSRHKKESKYEPIIDAFLESKEKLATIEVANIDANYLRLQLKKRIDARDLQDKIKVSVVNNVTYLEK